MEGDVRNPFLPQLLYENQPTATTALRYAGWTVGLDKWRHTFDTLGWFVHNIFYSIHDLESAGPIVSGVVKLKVSPYYARLFQYSSPLPVKKTSISYLLWCEIQILFGWSLISQMLLRWICRRWCVSSIWLYEIDIDVCEIMHLSSLHWLCQDWKSTLLSDTFRSQRQHLFWGWIKICFKIALTIARDKEFISQLARETTCTYQPSDQL